MAEFITLQTTGSGKWAGPLPRRIDNDVLQTFRVHWRTLVTGLVLGVSVAALLSWSAVKTYTSSTQVFVNVSRTSDSASAYEGNLFSQQRVASYAQILAGPGLAQRVVDELHLPMTAQQVAGEVIAIAVPGTVVLDVQVTDSSPERAQAIATSLGHQFTQQVTALETPDGSAASAVRIDTIKDADYNLTPVSPNTLSNLWRGAAIGLALAVLVAVIRVRTDNSVKDEDDFLDTLGLAVVARLPDDLRAKRHAVTALDQSRAAAATRSLAAYLRHLDPERRPQVLTVISALPGEGKTTVAVGLAVELVRVGHSVALVDANLDRPRVSRFLGLPDDFGLVDVLDGSTQLSKVAQQWQGSGLTVVPAGPLPPDPSTLLGSGQMRAVLKLLRSSHDFVIIDAPPVLPVADAAVLAAMADTCLVVTRFGRTERQQLERSVAAVRLLGGRVLGVVLTRVPRSAVPQVGRAYRPDRKRKPAPADLGRSVAPPAGDPAPSPRAVQPERVGEES